MQKMLSLVVICCSMLFEMGLGFAENRLHLGNKNKNLRYFILYCTRFALSLHMKGILPTHGKHYAAIETSIDMVEPN